MRYGVRGGLTIAFAIVALAASTSEGAPAASDDGTVRLPAGVYVPFYARESAQPSKPEKAHAPAFVAAFRLDRFPVTNNEFLAFVRSHPQWSRSRVRALFADGHYLQSWASDFALADASGGDRPVTGVSWFAAQAYCRAHGKSLPTTDQWEYALFDNGRRTSEVRARILGWYATPNTRKLPAVTVAQPNGFGVSGLVGFVWEWTLDFNSLMSDADLRGNNAKFCGGASLGAADPTDYASFMRYSMRASLKASYTTNNLGFRCAAPL